MKTFIVDGVEYDDYRLDYWDSYGDYHEIYDEKLNFLDRGICKEIAYNIKCLPKNSIVVISNYLKEFQITNVRESLRFAYEILTLLEGIVILPKEHYYGYIGFPYNMPYLKIK